MVFAWVVFSLQFFFRFTLTSYSSDCHDLVWGCHSVACMVRWTTPWHKHLWRLLRLLCMCILLRDQNVKPLHQSLSRAIAAESQDSLPCLRLYRSAFSEIQNQYQKNREFCFSDTVTHLGHYYSSLQAQAWGWCWRLLFHCSYACAGRLTTCCMDTEVCEQTFA